jgi:hypothetical protein
MPSIDSVQILVFLMLCSCSKSPDVDDATPGPSYADVNKEVEDEAPSKGSGTRADPTLVPLKGAVVLDGQHFVGGELGGYVALIAFADSTKPEQATHLSTGFATDAGSLALRLNVPGMSEQLDGLEVSFASDPAGSNAGFSTPNGAMIASAGTATVTALEGNTLRVTLRDLQLNGGVDGALHTLDGEIVGPLRVDCYVPQSSTNAAGGISSANGETLWARDAELAHEFCALLPSLAAQP